MKFGGGTKLGGNGYQKRGSCKFGGDTKIGARWRSKKN